MDSSDVDTLLAQAENPAAEVQDGSAPTMEGAVEPGVTDPIPPAPAALDPVPVASVPAQAADPALARVLRLRVPVIVRLAERRMPLALIRDLSVGVIIEFLKAVDEPLELFINNHPIGHGSAVRVGENFGLRIAEICTPADRIRSLGA
jgi:flagellar motor switch/type III secretory pathway protein FliN